MVWSKLQQFATPELVIPSKFSGIGIQVYRFSSHIRLFVFSHSDISSCWLELADERAERPNRNVCSYHF